MYTVLDQRLHLSVAGGTMEERRPALICPNCVQEFKSEHSFYQHMRDKHQAHLSVMSAPSPRSSATKTAPFQAAKQAILDLAQIMGVCSKFDSIHRQGQAACVVLDENGNGDFSMLEVHFAGQHVVVSPGDPPEPYIGQMLLLENVIYCPLTSLHWAGSVKDGRGTIPNGIVKGDQTATPRDNKSLIVQHRASSVKSEDARVHQLSNGVIQNVFPAQGYGFISKSITDRLGRKGEVYFQYAACQFPGEPVRGQLVVFKEEVGRKGLVAREIQLTSDADSSFARALQQRESATLKVPKSKVEVPFKLQRKGSISSDQGTQRNEPVSSKTLPSPYIAPPLDRPLVPGEYQTLLSLLEGEHGLEYVNAGIAVLGRTKSSLVESLTEAHDSATRLAMLVMLLADEMDAATVRLLETESIDNSTTARSQETTSRVPAQSSSRAPPVRSQTFFCFQCMADESLGEVFIVSDCQHSICRRSIREHILE